MLQILILFAVASAVLGTAAKILMDRADRRAELEAIERKLARRRERDAAIARGDIGPDAPKPGLPKARRRRR